jgi:hypothetical protein
MFVEPSPFEMGLAKKPMGWSFRQALRSSLRRPLAIPPDILTRIFHFDKYGSNERNVSGLLVFHNNTILFLFRTEERNPWTKMEAPHAACRRKHLLPFHY